MSTAASPPTAVDVHQHLWTEPLLDALAARDRLPFVTRSDHAAIVHCAGERAYAIDLTTENPACRVRLVEDDGLDLALIAPSSPIGIEALPGDEARELIAAYLTGVESLPGAFAAWGPVALDQADAGDVDDVLAHGCVGITLPAGALATPDGLDHVEPLIARANELDAPVFIHPGPGLGGPTREASLTEPVWWTAMTDYVAQMQAAWLAFATIGRRRHPHLRVVFALLAGGAPSLSERLAVRGGPPIDLRDPFAFYESSSFGARAIEAMIERVGADQVVYGSDRPVVEPPPTERDPMLRSNAARLVSRVESAVAA
ncbi:MAG TPA: amidohydrolase family protein [Solirubrobacteraceae bacterium]|nr:amidohydrolase family protein [Solirubrobacteraceae bacterium]